MDFFQYIFRNVRKRPASVHDNGWYVRHLTVAQALERDISVKTHDHEDKALFLKKKVNVQRLCVL